MPPVFLTGRRRAAENASGEAWLKMRFESETKAAGVETSPFPPRRPASPGLRAWGPILIHLSKYSTQYLLLMQVPNPRTGCPAVFDTPRVAARKRTANILSTKRPGVTKSAEAPKSRAFVFPERGQLFRFPGCKLPFNLFDPKPLLN